MKRIILLLLALVAIIILMMWTKQNKPFEEVLKEAPIEVTATPTPIQTINIESHDREPTPTVTVTPTPQPTLGQAMKKVETEKWYPKLKNSLLAFQPKKTKVFMEGIDGDNFGDDKEVLLVTYILPSGNRSSFKALLDTKTGLILRTWDQTQFEPFKKKAVLLSPSGGLK